MVKLNMNKGRLIAGVVLGALFTQVGMAAVPVGDGKTDDTDAIQALLDQKGLVELPKPKDCYLISRSLRIGSDTELRVDKAARILLAPGSNCPLLVNADVTGGNARITVTGGIWDMDNLKQSPNPGWQHLANPPRPRVFPDQDYDPTFYRGNALYFENVRDFRFGNTIIRNPVTYAFQLCRVCDFTVDGVWFDFTSENPIKGNMDGIHLDGGCHRGRIANIRGTCWDDLVAINANDGLCAAFQAEISDIVIENLESEYCHSAVRLLSAPCPVRRVRIRNVKGRFYQYAIGFTQYFPQHPAGLFEDISIEHVRVCKVPPPDAIPGFEPPGNLPTIFFDSKIKCNRVTLDDVEILPPEPRPANWNETPRPACAASPSI